MSKKNYYIESDAIDMCIERMYVHRTTMEQRAIIAMSFMAGGHKDVSRLIEAILYGDDCYFGKLEGKEIEQISSELEAEDGKNDM